MFLAIKSVVLILSAAILPVVILLPSIVVVLLLIAAAYYRTKISHTVLFWAAFILTRPLGAVVGDFLDKPIQSGGLELNRFVASMVLLSAIVVFVAVFRQRAARLAH